MTSQPGKQTIGIRSKSNQTVKFGQFIEHSMRNIFLDKLYTKCGGKIIRRPFSKKSKLSISRDMQFVFVVVQVEGYRHIVKLNCRPLAFTSYKAFLRHKKRSGTSLPASFSA